MGDHQRVSIKSILSGAVSAAALLSLFPDVANAQCTPNPPSPGDTVTCSTGSYPGIVYNVNDLTVVVGEVSGAASVVNSSGTAIYLTSASGSLTLDLVNTGTYVNASGGSGNAVYMLGALSHADVRFYGEGTMLANSVGVHLINAGTGAIEAQNDGIIYSSNNIALLAEGSGTGVYLTNNDFIQGSTGGVRINANGTGDAELLNTGNIYSTSSSAAAVHISTGASSGSISVRNTGLIDSQNDGVFVHHTGTGSANIRIYGDIEAGVNGSVLDISMAASTQDLIINNDQNLSSFTESTFEILHQGAGALRIYNSGLISGGTSYTSSDAVIDITAASTVSDIVIDSSSGTIRSGAIGSDLINLDISGGTTVDIDLWIGEASSGSGVVITGTSSSGAISLTHTFPVHHAEYIFYFDGGTTSTSDVTVTTATLTSDATAFFIQSAGGVALDIGSGTSASYAADHGIFIESYESFQAETLSVTLNNFTTNGRVVDIDTTGRQIRDIAITSTGTLDAGGDAIYLQSLAPGHISIDVNDLIAGNRAIFAVSQRSDITVTSTGDITSISDAIHLSQFLYDGGFTDINVNDVSTSSGYAIWVDMGYGGAHNDGVQITTTGTIIGEILVEVHDVTRNATAAQNAVDVTTGTYGDTTIIVGGDVDGGRFGIVTDTVVGAAIYLGADSSITGGTAAIRTQGSGASDRIEAAGAINADILMLDNSDFFIARDGMTLDAGARIDLGVFNDTFSVDRTTGFTGIDGAIRGGLGDDSLIFTFASMGTFTGSGFQFSQVRQFEQIFFNNASNWTLADTHFNYDITTFRTGSDTVLAPGARLFSDDIFIEDGASVDMGNGASFNRTMVLLEGTLDIGGSGTTGAANILGTLNVDNSGVINMDAVAAGDNDLLRLLGAFAGQGTINLEGNGTLNLNQTYALETGQYIIINAVQEVNGTFGAVNGLGSGGGLTQSLLYNNTNHTVRVLTETAMMSPEDTGSKSSASAANYLLSQLGGTSEYAQLGFDVGTMASVAEIGDFASGITPDVLDSAVMVGDGAALRFSQSLASCDVNFSMNAAESCAALPGSDGPALFGEIRQTSANTGTEVGHNFNARSFDMTFGVRLTDGDDAVQFGLMSGYAKSGSVSDAYYSDPTTPLTPAQAGAYGESAWVPAFAGMSGIEKDASPVDGLEAETFSLGAFARRDLGWWSLDGTAMVSTSVAKMVRNITPGLGIAEQAQSEFVSRQVNLQGTATLNGLGSSGFWVKPLATVGNRTLQRDGFTESGADLLGLTVDAQTRNVSYAGIGAEIAPDFTDESGNGFRGLLRVTGLAFAGDTSNDFTARFTNALGDSSFTYFGQNLDTSVLLEGGFQYIASDGFAVGAEGFGEINPETGDSSAVGATLQLIKRW